MSSEQSGSHPETTAETLEKNLFCYWYLELGLSSPWNFEKLLCKPRSPWCFVTAALTDSHMQGNKWTCVGSDMGVRAGK